MRSTLAFALFLFCLPAITAQNAIPSGTLVPVMLDTGLNAAKAHAGQPIHATVMQDIPGTEIRRRARITGRVVDASTGDNGQERISFVFDAVRVNGEMVPLKTNLRALASFAEVQEAQIPEEMGDYGLSPETWNTQQIGGEQFYRSGGPVARGITTVGKTTPWGALDVPRTQRGQPCRGVVGDNNQPQAMWWFSSDACGVYGFEKVRIEHAGRSNPVGTIILWSEGKLKLGSGAALLLRVIGSA